MSLLQGGQDKRAIKNASWALANLAKSNSDNKAAIREAKGIQVGQQNLLLLPGWGCRWAVWHFDYNSAATLLPVCRCYCSVFVTCQKGLVDGVHTHEEVA